MTLSNGCLARSVIFLLNQYGIVENVKSGWIPKSTSQDDFNQCLNTILSDLRGLYNKTIIFVNVDDNGPGEHYPAIMPNGHVVLCIDQESRHCAVGMVIVEEESVSYALLFDPGNEGFKRTTKIKSIDVIGILVDASPQIHGKGEDYCD